MMDEYVEATDGGFRAVDPTLPHSCHRFGRVEIVAPLERGPAGAPPDPARPALAARPGGPDRVRGPDRGGRWRGPVPARLRRRRRARRLQPARHRAPTPGPGWCRCRTRTRRDNLATFPTFGGELDAVPRYGVTVGVATIRERSAEVVMVVHGADKTTRRPSGCPPPPRTTPTGRRPCGRECRNPHLYLDRAAATTSSARGHHLPVSTELRKAPPWPRSRSRTSAAAPPGPPARWRRCWRTARSSTARTSCSSTSEQDRLDLVERIAKKLVRAQGLDITVETTTDQRAGLTDVDAVLSSFRPGGFELRQADELIPMRHGVIGQETQGPGGMMMSFRSIQVIQSILADLDAVAAEGRDLQLHQPRQHRLPGRHHSQRPADLLDVRGADDVLAADPHHRRARPRAGRGDDGRGEPQLLVDGAHLRR